MKKESIKLKAEVVKRELNKSFFIGRVPMDTEEDTVEVNINKKDNIKQPHLNYSESSVIDTKWKGIKDVY
jgi:hypothetical protein